MDSAAVAPLRNVVALRDLITRAKRRGPHLPGLVVFSGFSGWGKSFAAAHAAVDHRCYLVQARSGWSRRALMLAICRQLGITPGQTTYEMVDQAAEELGLSNRPLLLDEFDHLCTPQLVETIRDLYEASLGTICLIGEERLPAKLGRWERVHGRVMDWAQAQAADLDDARKLAKLYHPNITIADDLLSRIVGLARGSARRICVNLERVAAAAGAHGFKLDLKSWGDRELWSGEAPPARNLPEARMARK